MRIDREQPRIEEITPEFLETVKKAANYVPVISEDVHVPGYGMVSLERAHKEADLAHTVASEHATKGNHMHAAYQHERAAMFHRAIHSHMEANKPQETVQVAPSPQRSDLNVPESTVVESEKQSPEGRVKEKFKRALARNFKQRDKQKQERKDE